MMTLRRHSCHSTKIETRPDWKPRNFLAILWPSRSSTAESSTAVQRYSCLAKFPIVSPQSIYFRHRDFKRLLQQNTSASLLRLSDKRRLSPKSSARSPCSYHFMRDTYPARSERMRSLRLFLGRTMAHQALTRKFPPSLSSWRNTSRLAVAYKILETPKDGSIISMASF